MTPRTFEAYGWHVIRGIDGHDADARCKRHGRSSRRDRQTVSADVQNHHRFFRFAEQTGTHDSRRAAGRRAEIALTREQLLEIRAVRNPV